VTVKTKKKKKELPPAEDGKHVIPTVKQQVTKIDHRREWERGSELISIFAITGYIKGEHAESIILVGDPATGKTELIERFMSNQWLAFYADVTRRGLDPILEDAKRGRMTHLVLTEMQTIFERRMSVAGNTMTTMAQAMEEGVGKENVGGRARDFQGATFGLIAGITHGTLYDRKRMLFNYGILSRASTIVWDPPDKEILDILDRVDRGDKSDLSPITLTPPPVPVHVDLDPKFSKPLTRFAYQLLKNRSLRFANRLRRLAMACAILEGRQVVRSSDIERVMIFRDYWAKQVTEL
jgi:GTPase SAR1 family protein